MSRHRKRNKTAGKFTMLTDQVQNSAAWKSLNPVARALYLELRRRYNGANNGMIGLACREAAEKLNVGRNVANRAFGALQDHGFIAVAQRSSFHQKRLATEWLLTELRDDRTGHLPSKDFARWSPKNQNIVPLVGRIVPLMGHEKTQENSDCVHSPAGGTVSANSALSQSRPWDTYKSTISRSAP